MGSILNPYSWTKIPRSLLGSEWATEWRLLPQEYHPTIEVLISSVTQYLVHIIFESSSRKGLLSYRVLLYPKRPRSSKFSGNVVFLSTVLSVITVYEPKQVNFVRLCFLVLVSHSEKNWRGKSYEEQCGRYTGRFGIDRPVIDTDFYGKKNCI